MQGFKIPVMLLLSLLPYSYGKKVVFLPLQQGSHMNTQKNIIKEMLSRGHEVYQILGDRFGANFKDKIISQGVKILWFKQSPQRKYTGENIDKLYENILNDHNSKTMKQVWDISCAVFDQDCYDMFVDESFIRSIKAVDFDIAVIDYWHAVPCAILLPYNLSIPFVIQSVAIPPWLIREPALPSFVPWILGGESDKMTFWQRIMNLIEYGYVYDSPSPARVNKTLLHKYAPGMDGFNSVFREAMFYISMRNHILEWPQPIMPNNVRLFGTTFSKAQPLTGKLGQIMENAKNAIIVVSFGSMGGKIPYKYVIQILQALDHYSENTTVVFSYSGDINLLGHIPKHVHIFPWLPQNDVLGHPKTKLFITHGGHNGQTEAIYHGVPMITMPLYFEQFHNAFRIEQHLYGLSVNIYDFTPNELSEKINTVLFKDKQYRENCQQASAIVKGLSHPSAIAADWIEHVMKFGGDHLRSAAMDMNLYEFLMLDILAFVFGAIFFMVLFIVLSVKMLSRKYFSSDTLKQKIN